MYKKLLVLIFLLALFLRIYKVNQPVFKGDENTTVQAASYVYYCQQDKGNCQTDLFQSGIFRKTIALLVDNETEPNLFTSIYFWDWLKNSPTSIHYSRAWPNLYLIASVYQALGINHLSSRLISIVSGSLLILVGFFLARLLDLSLPASLLYTFVLAVSPHLINFSRNARMYSLFSFLFLLVIYQLIKYINSQKIKYLFLAILFSLPAHFLHLIFLLLPLSLLFYFLYQSINQKDLHFYLPTVVLFFLLIFVFIAKGLVGFDFFHSHFIAPQSLPHWPYLNFIFGAKPVAIIGLIIIFLNFKKILASPAASLLFFILFTHLIFFIFFSQFPLGSAYVIHLLSLAYLLAIYCLNSRLTKLIFISFILLTSLSSCRPLYQTPFDRPQLTQAYQKIYTSIKPKDQIIAYHPRTYYLRRLPSTISLIPITQDQSYTVDQLTYDISNSAGNTFIVFEPEKTIHFPSGFIDYLASHFTKIAGEGIDDYQVEIYYLGK